MNITDAVQAALVRLNSGLHHVAIWSRFAASAHSHVGSVEPMAPNFAFGNDDDAVLRAVRASFVADAQRAAFVRTMAEWEVFLLELTVLVDIVDALQGRSHLTAEQFNQVRRKARAKAQNTGADAQVRRLVGEPDAEVVRGTTWFADMYRVRNCIVHRAAVVAQEDTKGEAELRVTWSRLFIRRKGAETNEPFAPGATLLGGDSIVLGFHERAWRDGEQVALDVHEIQEIAIGLAQLGGTLCRQLHRRFETQLPATDGASA